MSGFGGGSLHALSESLPPARMSVRKARKNGRSKRRTISKFMNYTFVDPPAPQTNYILLKAHLLPLGSAGLSPPVPWKEM